MSLPLTHAGGSVDGISAALDLRFASSLSLTSTSGLTPSFSRASTGTFFNSSGVLTTAAINGPRFDHAYNGSGWVSKGLLVEEARTNLCTYSEQLSQTSWGFLTNVTVSANAGSAPDGTVTADLIYPTASAANCEIGKDTGTVSTSSVIYTNSYFLKAAGKTWARVLSIRGDFGAWFNLATGTIGTILSGSVATIQNVGNGWFRCAVARTTDLTTGYTFVKISDADNSNTVTASGIDGILVWGAQSELGAFPTSYIPTTTAAVTRSADVCQITGTDFSGFWNTSEGSFVTEADSIGFASTGSDRYIVAFNSSGTANIAHAIFLPTTGLSFDVYNSTLQARVSYTQPNAGDSFKLASCYKANDFAATLNGSAVQTDTSGTVPTINNVGIGYYPSFNQYANCHIARLRYFNKRLTNNQLEDLCKPEQQLKLDLNFSSNLSLTPTVGPTPSFSRASTGTYFNSSGVLTTAAVNGPRFNHVYNGSSWVSKGLLVEEQRTNLNLYSEQFDNAAYSKNQGTVTANQIAAPDGSTTADKFTASAGTVNPYAYQALTTANGSVYTFSIFVKKDTHDFVQIVLNGVTNGYANFDIASGVVGTLGAGGSATSSIVNCGNGWYRCSVKYTTASTSGNGFINLIGSATAGRGATFSAAGTEAVYLWGQQLELGSFPTSYIPTTSASVTRSADVCQITGANFSSFWNAGEGSFAVEFDWLQTLADVRNFPVSVQVTSELNSNGRTLKHIIAGQSDLSAVSYYIENTSNQAMLNSSAMSDARGVVRKFSCGYKLNDSAISLLGGSAITDTACTMPAGIAVMELMADSTYGARYSGHIARLRYYAIRLPNRLLIAKST